ncbi:MAG TPA: NF041680 family putative transposase [Streptosporangiaceae bacterium]|nr:NF041680 family putative transposase [Streptosporangiaceae bacterium]
MAFIMSWHESGDEADAALGRLAGFRRELYWCLGMRRDALFEACDALACKPGRVLMLAELCLEPECRRGHGGLYDAVNSGEVHFARLRRALSALPLPIWDDGRIRLACDVSNWLRPDAETSPERLFCHCYARGEGNAQLIPGWPYSFIAALEPGRTSWTLPLDAVRLGPADDATEVTAAQLRDVVARLAAAGHWKPGDPDILAVLDAGYDLTRLAFLLDGLPLEILGRLRSDRVMYFPAPPRAPRATGRPSRHGAPLRLSDPATWPDPAVATRTGTTRYGTAEALAWPRLHQRLTRRAAWEDHEGELPVIEGILIRLAVDHLPGQRDAEPLWLWSSRAGAGEEAVNRAWQAFLRRFDLEHTFRFLKQALGWARPKLRDPAAADRWTWLVIAAYAQLHLARGLAADTRLPWQRPCPPGRLTPSRVRAGFRRIRQDLPVPASAPKPSRPGPGRPAGSKNQRPATRHDVGKTVKRTETKPRNQQADSLNNKLRAC